VTREETIAATMDTTKVITNAIKLDGSLKGKVPEAFDGDHTKTQKFLNMFSLFWMNNEDNSHMKIPIYIAVRAGYRARRTGRPSGPVRPGPSWALVWAPGSPDTPPP
jgi:hypothetical protein